MLERSRPGERPWGYWEGERGYAIGATGDALVGELLGMEMLSNL